jgi:hypothetical protein
LCSLGCARVFLRAFKDQSITCTGSKVSDRGEKLVAGEGKDEDCGGAKSNSLCGEVEGVGTREGDDSYGWVQGAKMMENSETSATAQCDVKEDEVDGIDGSNIESMGQVASEKELRGCLGEGGSDDGERVGIIRDKEDAQRLEVAKGAREHRNWGGAQEGESEERWKGWE